MLFESEQMNRKLRIEMQEKDKTIKDLHADIYFSDLELKDIQQIMELSADVQYMNKLNDNIKELQKANNVLSELISCEFTF